MRLPQPMLWSIILLVYLTRKPKTQTAIELKKLTRKLTKISKLDFINHLNNWHLRWNNYLNERRKSPSTGKTCYKHKRLRTAYLSWKKHLPYLFVFEDYKELMIPNTTNALDGQFANLKNKLRNHNDLSKKRKTKRTILNPMNKAAPIFFVLHWKRAKN